MLYVFAGASTLSLLFALLVFWLTRSRRARRLETVQNLWQTRRKDDTSSPCSRGYGMYEIINPPGPVMQENEIYHSLDIQAHETSLGVKERPSTSSPVKIPSKFDRLNPGNTIQIDQHNNQSAFYYEIDNYF